MIESYGAQVILHGNVFNEANAFGMKMAEEEENTLYVHPFADSEVFTFSHTHLVISIYLQTKERFYTDSRERERERNCWILMPGAP